jgi:hypothetical protein
LGRYSHPTFNFDLVVLCSKPSCLATILQPTLAHRHRHNSTGFSWTDLFRERCHVASCLLGYGFVIEGIRRAGIFAIYGTQDGNILRRLEDKLAGGSVDVRYDPSDLGLSYLVDLHDSRFEGLTVTQNPEWVSQAPEFHIEDVIR